MDETQKLEKGSNCDRNYGALMSDRVAKEAYPEEEEARGIVPPPAQHGPKTTFAVVSVSYLSFTLTDGALRMVLLLTAYKYGFSAIEIALMFALYESFGVITNVRTSQK